jgi:hypothetical protein
VKTVQAARACVVAAVLLPTAAAANDRWESGSNPSLSNDDTPTTTRNELRHGDRQTGHDLEGTPAAPDRDHYIVRTEIYHTYEALVHSTTLFWGTGTAFCVPPGGTSVCPRFDLVASDGSLLRAAEPDGGASNNSNVTSALRLHMYGNGVTSYLRVTGDTGGSTHTAADQYEIEFRDTTYSAPRFNNSGTQITILMIQNTTDRAVHVDSQLFDDAGALVTIYGNNIPPHGLWVNPLASAPAAQGKAGSVLIRHDGPYGALNGKAVSLEPATGFTFDTPIAPIFH